MVMKKWRLPMTKENSYYSILCDLKRAELLVHELENTKLMLSKLQNGNFSI